MWGPELELRPHDSKALILPQQACQLQAVWEESSNRVSFQKALRIPPPPGMQLKFCIVMGSCRGASLLAGSEFKGSSKYKKNGYWSFPGMMLVTLMSATRSARNITAAGSSPGASHHQHPKHPHSSSLPPPWLSHSHKPACCSTAGSNNKDLCELPFTPHTRVTPLTVGKAQ